MGTLFAIMAGYYIVSGQLVRSLGQVASNYERKKQDKNEDKYRH